MFFGVLLAVYVVAYWGGGWLFSVFLINLIMSTEFIVRQHRDHTNWASLWIAVCKLAGTLSASILNGAMYRNALVLWLGGLCLLADIYYTILLLNERKGKEYEAA